MLNSPQARCTTNPRRAARNFDDHTEPAHLLKVACIPVSCDAFLAVICLVGCGAKSQTRGSAGGPSATRTKSADAKSTASPGTANIARPDGKALLKVGADAAGRRECGLSLNPARRTDALVALKKMSLFHSPNWLTWPT